MHNPAPSSAVVAVQPRHDVVEWLRRKLQHEQLETGGSYSAAELAYRRAWNARGTALLADLNLYVGLAELAACDVDGGR